MLEGCSKISLQEFTHDFHNVPGFRGFHPKMVGATVAPNPASTRAGRWGPGRRLFTQTPSNNFDGL